VTLDILDSANVGNIVQAVYSIELVLPSRSVRKRGISCRKVFLSVRQSCQSQSAESGVCVKMT